MIKILHFLSIALAVFSLALMGLQPVHAQTMSQVPSSMVLINGKYIEKAKLDAIESYLSAMTTLQADFMQVDPQNVISSGKFYLSRPGKARWEYSPPIPILIVANGSLVTYYDKTLEQASRIPMDDSLANFLVRKDINFGEAIHIVDVHEQDGYISITLKDEKNSYAGLLRMVFFQYPMEIKSLEVIDVNGSVTRISFYNSIFGQKVDKKLFNAPQPSLSKRLKR